MTFDSFEQTDSDPNAAIFDLLDRNSKQVVECAEAIVAKGLTRMCDILEEDCINREKAIVAEKVRRKERRKIPNPQDWERYLGDLLKRYE